MHGRFAMREFSSLVFLLNSVPTIIQEGNEKFVAFSHATHPNKGKNEWDGTEPDRKFVNSDFLPSLFFFSVSRRQETTRMKGIEALIDYFSDPENPG